MLRRAALLVSIATPLVAIDLAHKLAVPTEEWAYHPRGAAWIAMAAVVTLGCLGLTRVPSTAVAAIAAVLAAGAGANGLSAVLWERGVPNPLVVDLGEAVIAFNLADILALVGVLLLMVELSSVTIRNRAQLLPPRAFARMLWQRVRS